MIMKYISAITRYGQIFAHKYMHPANISGGEHAILMFLTMQPTTNQDNIAQFLMLDKSAIAKNLATLEEKELISRMVNPQNRREKLITLTTKGHTCVSQLEPVKDEWEDGLFAGVSDEERELFYKIAAKIAENAKTLSKK